MSEPIIEVSHLKNFLGNQWVHEDLNLTVKKGEIVGIIGGSGSGKTTLLNSMLKLIKPTSGSIKIGGIDILHAKEAEVLKIRQRWGVLFQQGALFSSLTVIENVAFPLRIFTRLSKKLQKRIAMLKIALVGLPASAVFKYPAELSGGMIKRVALARAIALDPEILFLDEPTSGLDPQSSNELCKLILNLREGLGLSVVVITHDVDLLLSITDRVVFLAQGKVLAESPIEIMLENDNPIIADYFSNLKRIKSEIRAQEKKLTKDEHGNEG